MEAELGKAFSFGLLFSLWSGAMQKRKTCHIRFGRIFGDRSEISIASTYRGHSAAQQSWCPDFSVLLLRGPPMLLPVPLGSDGTMVEWSPGHVLPV